MENKDNFERQQSFFGNLPEGFAAGQNTPVGGSGNSRRRQKNTVGDFSSFGVPMKAEVQPVKAESSEEEYLEDCAGIPSDITEEELQEKEEVESSEENFEENTEESESFEEIFEEKNDEISEKDAEEYGKSDTDSEEKFEDTEDFEEALETGVSEDTCVTEEYEVDGDEGLSVPEFGQIRGFGCDISESNEQDSESEEETCASEEQTDSDLDGIQQRFDITFLEPMTETEEVEAKSSESKTEFNEVINEVAEDILVTDAVYEDSEEIEEVEEETTEECDESDDGDTVRGEVTEDNIEEYSEAEDLQTAPETQTVRACDDDSEDSEVNEESEAEDIWNDDEREAWTAKERFLEHCRSLSVPPLKITKSEKIQKKRPPKRNTVSGYQYETVERLPLDEGTRVIENEADYRKREKLFCSKRAKTEGKKLAEKTNKMLLKLWFTVAFSVVILGLDCMNFIKSNGVSFIGANSVTAFCIAELVLLAIVSLISLDVLRDGIFYAFKGNHIPETFAVMNVFIGLAYHGALLLLNLGDTIPVIMGLPAAIALVLARLYRYYMIRRDFKAFVLAAPYRSYTTEVKMKDFASTPEYTEFSGYAPRESELYKINKIYRIDGICEMSPVRDTCFGIIRILSILVLCTGIVSGILFGLVQKSVADGIFGAWLMVALACPIAVFVSMYVPRVKVSAAAEKDGAAIIGFDEESSDFDKNVIMLDDSEIYHSETLSPKIEVCNTPELENHLHRIASLFHRLGGTLGGLFKNAGFEDYKEVELREIDAHGMYAIVDGSDVIAGSEKYLLGYGIKVNRYDGELGENSGVLYVADSGQFFCRIIMTFKPDIELCRRISELRNADTLVSLKSCNPCIDENLVFTTTGLEPELLKLIKYSSGDDVSPAETDREGTLVSFTGASGLFSALLEYKRQKKLIQKGGKFAIASCVIGAVAASALLLAGHSVIPYAPTAVLAVHLVLSLVAGVIGSRKAIDTRTVIKKK